jgi:hypothetical protein
LTHKKQHHIHTKPQEDLRALARRVTGCEVAAGQASAALNQARRLTAKLADDEARMSDMAGRLAALAGATADGVARVTATEAGFRSKVGRETVGGLFDGVGLSLAVVACIVRR